MKKKTKKRQNKGFDMDKFFISKIALIATLVISATWASPKGDCLKKAKEDFKIASTQCKTIPGNEKKACMKTAKTNLKVSRAACKSN
jgi:hypothetical protein